MIIRNILCAGVCVLGFVGCGDDEDGGGSGVDRSKSLSDLTAEEATQLCEAHAASLQVFADKVCIITALAVSADPATCETALDACENTPIGGDAGTGSGSGCETPTTIQNCDATVGEVEDCESDLVNHAESLSCDDAGDLPPAPECAVSLAEKCPGLVPTLPTGS